MKKFSLLLYVHNAQDFLPQCLNSLLKQTEKDFELLIFDNASTDGTLPCLKIYQKKDKRVKIFSCNEEENIATIKNSLLKSAQGEVVAFLPLAEFKDSFLKYAWRKLNAGKYDSLIIRSNKEYIKFPRCSDGVYSVKNNKHELFSFNLPVIENIFFSNSFLKKIKAKFINTEFGSDFIFYIQTVISAEKICYVNKNLLKTKAVFCNFCNRELSNYRQIEKSFNYGMGLIEKANLRQSGEKFFIECFYIYLQLIIHFLPFPVKNFFKGFVVDNFIKVIDPEKYDHKNYTLPVVLNWFSYLKQNTYPSAEFEKCFYSQPKNITAIALSADNNKDLMYNDILIQSIINNADVKKFYDIYIFCRNDLAKNIIEAMQKKSGKNICINFININEYIPDNAFISIYKTSSLYFFIPDMLTKYKRVIYLKNNVISLRDLSVISKIDMHNMPIAGAKDYANEDYVENKLKLISETYINDNVLLFDIPKCRKINLSRKFLNKISSETKIYEAHDILNMIALDYIYVFDAVYNCKVDILNGNRIIKDYPYKIDDVVLLNYENHLPYINLWRDYADIWWKYARQSMFYEVLNVRKKDTVSDRECSLMSKYIKEAILRIFTFGDTAKKHKENMIKLQSLVSEEHKL